MPYVYIQYLMLNMKTYKVTHQPYLILGNISITLIRNTTARWSIFGSRERERWRIHSAQAKRCHRPMRQP